MSNMKRIVHLTTVHPVFDARIFHKQCVSLAKNGHEVFLLASGDLSKQSSTISGVKILTVGKARNRLHRMTLFLWKVYRTALDLDGDVYHFHDPELILVGLLLKLRGKKVIYDVHEDVPRDILLKPWLPKKLRGICGKFFEQFENISARFFNAIVTVTPLLATRFQRNNIQTLEIRNYPLHNASSYTSDLKKNGLCYAGLISRERGIFEMLQASVRCNIRLNLAGKFNCAELQNEVTNHEYWSASNYLGYLDRAEIEKMYAESQIGLVILHPGPTFVDALPIKLFEYMAAGLPVVVSDFPLWREIVVKHNCGLCVNPQNIDDICEALSFLLNNTTVAAEMGLRGQQAVYDFYNWQVEEKKLLQLYDRILFEDKICAV